MMCNGFGYGPYGFGDPWSAAINGVFTLLVFGGLIALAVWAIRSWTRRPESSDRAVEILRRRLAAGEISQEDFEKTLRLIKA